MSVCVCVLCMCVLGKEERIMNRPERLARTTEAIKKKSLCGEGGQVKDR